MAMVVVMWVYMLMMAVVVVWGGLSFWRIELISRVNTDIIEFAFDEKRTPFMVLQLVEVDGPCTHLSIEREIAPLVGLDHGEIDTLSYDLADKIWLWDFEGEVQGRYANLFRYLRKKGN